jgi:protein-tyrosine phosphatase
MNFGTQEEPGRHIPLGGQANFRDLGGYQTIDGRSVKWRQVYRSGRLANLTDMDVTLLEDLGIRIVVNLLTADDIEIYGRDRLPAGARAISLPIDSDVATELANRSTEALRTADFSKIPGELNPEIHRILIHDGVDQYAALLREIANPANRPLVFHCSHGVHRTGTGAAILLALLGVPWETIRQDYLLSNEYRKEEVEKRLGQLQQMAAEKRGIRPEEVDMRNMEAFLIQKGSYIDASYDEIIKTYGAVDGFFREGLGLDEQEISQLRHELLEPAEELEDQA